MGYLLLAVVIAIVAAFVYLMIRYYPPLGGRVSGESRHAAERSQAYANGKFVNLIPTTMGATPKAMLSILGDYIKGNPNRRPKGTLPREPFQPELLSNPWEPKVLWFGHSSLLLQMNGLTLFMDPMLGDAPSPFPKLGGKRYGGRLALEPESIPQVDVVLLSHDHYDHLDYDTIKKLKDKAARFIVPLGVGVHLERWGVSREKITETDWWEELDVGELKLACTPARHFSGRNLTGRDGTLWCSWVIDGGDLKVFFSGDSGYGPHFRSIGDKYGPFDLTLMECGQYDPRWSNIHMMPEETVQAHMDVKGGRLLPIHWGAFTLALHDWFDPVERALAAARKHGVSVITPRIGQAVAIDAPNGPTTAWWREK